MASELFFRKTALRQLRLLDRNMATRILSKLRWFAAQPEPLAFAKPLKRSTLGTHRFRVGDWRVIILADPDEITIVDIGHRREIYR